MYSTVWKSRISIQFCHNYRKSLPICVAVRSYATDITRGDLDNVAKELNVQDMSDWYKIPTKDFVNRLGASVRSKYNCSPYQLLSSIYPEYNWLPWKFSNSPRNLWIDIDNQKKFMDWAGQQLNITNWEDWYHVSTQDIIKLGGNSLLNIYGRSMFKLLSAIFPNDTWLPWKFDHSPHGYWDMEKQREFMEMAGKKLNILNKSDWYNISKEDLYQFDGGIKLCRIYNNSMFQLLTNIYPQYGWLPWKFPKSSYYWKDPNNWKTFLQHISTELNVNKPSDWHKIKEEQFIDVGGGALLVKNRTFSQLLSVVYPEFPWEHKIDIWTNEHLANYFVEWLKKQTEAEVSYVYKIINEMGKENSILTQKLKSAFPKYNWIRSIQGQKKSQFMLKQFLEKIFPGNILLEEYKHPDITSNNYVLELDYFLPQFNLALEYQVEIQLDKLIILKGQQHYYNIKHFNQRSSAESSQYWDQHKLEACKELGITLIQIPYWWDRTFSSLAVTIYNSRPDLFKYEPKGKPIPLIPPSDTISKRGVTTNVLMTATEWDSEKRDPKGWYMTEKYDGMRLYWDGTHFYSRQGNRIKAPDSITKQMPTISLDGELWTQYGLYQNAIALSQTSNINKWEKATYWIFDAPDIAHSSLEERIQFLEQLSLPSFAKVIEFVKCEGKEHLSNFMNQVNAKGGEGVVLREPGSIYKAGRSTSLCKLKPYFDTEVKVVTNQYPHGFICEQANGKTLFVNLTSEHAEVGKQIKPGTVVTVKHSGMNVHGTLQYPQFYRERLDVKWSDVNKSL